MGCIGMTMDDFCGLTPEEFGHVAEAWHRQREADGRADWERMRLLATITIQPHVKGKLSPQRLLPFPWEEPEKKKTSRRPVSKEEDKKRFEALMKRMNGAG